MDRNFLDLLQELRVVQTGTQILAGFLLTLPFQARFEDLTAYHRTVFLVCISLAVLTTIFLVAPVSSHRMLFRRHLKDRLVQVSHVLASTGLVLLGLTMAVTLCLIFSVVVGDRAGLVAAAVVVVAFAATGWVVPSVVRSGSRGPHD